MSGLTAANAYLTTNHHIAASRMDRFHWCGSLCRYSTESKTSSSVHESSLWLLFLARRSTDMPASSPSWYPSRQRCSTDPSQVESRGFQRRLLVGVMTLTRHLLFTHALGWTGLSRWVLLELRIGFRRLSEAAVVFSWGSYPGIRWRDGFWKLKSTCICSFISHGRHGTCRVGGRGEVWGFCHVRC